MQKFMTIIIRQLSCACAIASYDVIWRWYCIVCQGKCKLKLRSIQIHSNNKLYLQDRSINIFTRYSFFVTIYTYYKTSVQNKLKLKWITKQYVVSLLRLWSFGNIIVFYYAPFKTQVDSFHSNTIVSKREENFDPRKRQKEKALLKPTARPYAL